MLCLQNGVLYQRLSDSLHTFLTSNMHATCTTYTILHDLIILLVCDRVNVMNISRQYILKYLQFNRMVPFTTHSQQLTKIWGSQGTAFQDETPQTRPLWRHGQHIQLSRLLHVTSQKKVILTATNYFKLCRRTYNIRLSVSTFICINVPEHIYILHTLSNTSRTLASDSPNHIVSNSGPFTEMKFAWHSLAMALARRVLPQPGGP